MMKSSKLSFTPLPFLFFVYLTQFKQSLHMNTLQYNETLFNFIQLLIIMSNTHVQLDFGITCVYSINQVF